MRNTFQPVNVSNFELAPSYISRKRNPFNDLRRYASWLALQNRMELCGSSVIHQLTQNDSECTRFYRFLSNAEVSMEELIYMSCQVGPEVIHGRHVLVLGDTTSYNLSSHMGRIQDADRIGVIEGNKTPGLMAHVHLALDAMSGDILGLGDVLLWTRQRVEGKTSPAYMQQWQEKESYKWALGVDNASEVLKAASERTFVLDRDADNYNLYLKFIQEAKDHFVIRSNFNRQVRIEDQIFTIEQSLEQSECLGSYMLSLPALDHYSNTKGKRVKRKARQALIEVRAQAINVLPPRTTLHPGGPELPLYIVQAKEVNMPMESDDPSVEWRLITNHPVESFEQAQDIIRFYVWRWVVEQLFRTSKKKGFDLEATQLETFDAIQRQTIMTLHACTKVLQLTYARGRKDAQPIEEVFNEEQRIVLSVLNERYQGKTAKQKNPFPKSRTSWATWIIARLGGWKGYASRRPPGPITIKRGLDQFYVFLQAFQMMKPSG